MSAIHTPAVPRFPAAATRITPRRLLLAAAAAATLAAVAWAARIPDPTDAEVVPARAASTPLGAARAAAQRRAATHLHPAVHGASAATPPRTSDAAWANELFATHSWYVAPPPPPPVKAPPPPPPSAPPFPYTYVGSFTPPGEATVYFLARADRVFEARVGDRMDNVYEFESAAGGQLVFNYLPLGIRQPLAGGTEP